MAGIAVLQLASDGKPELATDGQGAQSALIGGSPNKMQDVESPQKMSAKMEPAIVSVSPQGKGVGVFGLEGSPGMAGDNSDGPLKDPKVSRFLVVHAPLYTFFISICIHLYNI